MPKPRTKPSPDPITELYVPKIKPDIELLAIDPGDVYTGLALFSTNADGEWFCSDAQEFSPADFEDALTSTLLDPSPTPPPIVVFERWRLYADKAKGKTGDEFLTCQHIGVIKFLVRTHNDHVGMHAAADAAGKMLTCELPGRFHEVPANRPQVVTIFGQLADIKKPTAGICRHKGIKSVAKAISKDLYEGRDHVVDAELHGWCYILEQLHGEPATTS